ncbi:MAG TPA: oxygenase MpaB family protein [Acidimicrobiales bacterium]|nr:oxygenase MpaB family protein [Acidimicrobiales bacterium]
MHESLRRTDPDSGAPVAGTDEGASPGCPEVLARSARLLSAPLRAPLAVGSRLAGPVRSDLRRSIRRSLGLPGEPPPRAEGTGEAFLPPGAVARRVHGDLPAMVVGGLAALMLQTLHPLAMAGVADHSNYREDPIGRLRRTAAFVGATTFGTVEEANLAIDKVRDVHRHVHGRAPDGRRYAAGDPELLTWVHVAEVFSFLAAAERYGPHRFGPADRDRYFTETAVVARSLGARWVPESAEEVHDYFTSVRPELHAGPQAIEARDFLLHGVARRPKDRAIYLGIVASALAVVPRWARAELGIPAPLLLDELVVVPPARAFCGALRWMLHS